MNAPETELVEFAREASRHAETWNDLFNLVYGVGGEFVRLFPAESERTHFAATPEYQEVQRIISEKRSENGDASSEESGRAGGRILVRLPESIHAALITEAEREGVSLNQLILSKLCVQLKATV